MVLTWLQEELMLIIMMMMKECLYKVASVSYTRTRQPPPPLNEPIGIIKEMS